MARSSIAERYGVGAGATSHIVRASSDENRYVETAPSTAARAPACPRGPQAPTHSDEEVRAWFEHVVLPTKEVWVAETAGIVVAVLVLEEEWIDQLYVDPAHTGGGLGTALLILAKQRRPAGLKLWTFQANIRARRFYERSGFSARETSEGENEEGAPDVRYECRPSDRDPLP